MSSRQGYEQSVEFDEYGEFGKYGKLDYVLPKTKYNRMSSRQVYQQSGEFDEYGELGKYGKFDYILPKTKYNRMSNKVANLANMANFTIFCNRPKMHESERAQDNGTNKAANSTNAATFFLTLARRLEMKLTQ